MGGKSSEKLKIRRLILKMQMCCIFASSQSSQSLNGQTDRPQDYIQQWWPLSWLQGHKGHVLHFLGKYLGN